MGRSFQHLDKSLELIPKTHKWSITEYRKLKGPNGRNLCRQCGTEVPPNRSSYCSAECSHTWNLRTDSGYARATIFERDKGICAACGLDTTTSPNLQHHGYGEYYEDWRKRKDAWLTEHGYNPWHSTSPWEADHIVAVVDGGHDLGLDNLQTLCVPCHVKKTAGLAARRAQERKQSKGIPRQVGIPGLESEAA